MAVRCCGSSRGLLWSMDRSSGDIKAAGSGQDCADNISYQHTHQEANDGKPSSAYSAEGKKLLALAPAFFKVSENKYCVNAGSRLYCNLAGERVGVMTL